MNIVALILGLAPVPPLPPAVRERQNRIADERRRSTPAGRMTRQSAAAYRADMLQMLRETGPATTPDVAHHFDEPCKTVRAHLLRLCSDGLVKFRIDQHRSHKAYTWYVPGCGDA